MRNVNVKMKNVLILALVQNTFNLFIPNFSFRAKPVISHFSFLISHFTPV